MAARMRAFALVLILFTLIIGVPAVSAQEPTFGLSEEDRELLGDAIVLSGEEDFYAFDYTFTFTLTGVPDSGPVSIEMSGTGQWANQDMQLTLVGSATQGDETLPADFELRTIDGMVYVYVATEDRWYSLSEDELNALTGSAGVPANDAMGTFDDLATGFSLNPDDFITISRLADEAVNGVSSAHFQWNVSLVDLANSTGFTSSLDAISSQPEIASQLSAAGIDASQLGMVGMLLGLVFNDTTITLDHYVDPATDRITQAVFNMDMNVNPAMLGASGSTVPLILRANLAVSLRDYGVEQTIAVPDGAIPVTAEQVLGTTAGISDVTGGVPADTGAVAAPTVAAAVPTVAGGGVDILSLANVTPAATNEAIFALPTPTPGGAAPAGQTIAAGTPVAAQLTGTGPVDLTYTGSAGEVISISARSTSSPSVDTTVELLDSNGVRLGYNDDHGTTRTDLARFDSLIADITLPDSAPYTVRVDSFSGLAQGTVEVLVQSSGSSAAQPTPATSSGGDVITSVLEQGSSAEFPLTGAAGEVVSISVRALDNALDPRVTLLDSSGSTLASNDDHRTNSLTLGRFDSLIADFALPAAGTYTIRVDGFGGSGGSFELTVTRGGNAQPTLPTATPGSSINISGGEQVITGTLEQNGVFQHPLSVQPGNTYTFTVRGTGNFDPVLLVRDADGALITGNDDHNSSDGSLGRFDSRVLNYIFQEAQSVTVDVEEYDGEAGSFTLTVELVDDSAPLGNGTEQVFTGQVSANGTFSQPISAQAGDYVTIFVRGLTSDFDPVVALISPSGVLITDNDNHSSEQNIGDFDSFVRNVLITESGEHIIEVTGVRGSSGSFALTVRTLR